MLGVEVRGHAQCEVEADPGELEGDPQHSHGEKSERVLAAPRKDERCGGNARLQHWPDRRRLSWGRATEEFERERHERCARENCMRIPNEAHHCDRKGRPNLEGGSRARRLTPCAFRPASARFELENIGFVAVPRVAARPKPVRGSISKTAVTLISCRRMKERSAARDPRGTSRVEERRYAAQFGGSSPRWICCGR